ncbi:cell surface glycoprotein 1-like [Drosophila eugracilis]|uniref:cell surface glycoprotein 1-like n=1 Tax=Drosophila eugracilis TaxID=29029 RepID=UPI001BD94669|nr:cell surface glycoprotein 1-like [Drosophila eugracilis]
MCVSVPIAPHARSPTQGESISEVWNHRYHPAGSLTPSTKPRRRCQGTTTNDTTTTTRTDTPADEQAARSGARTPTGNGALQQLLQHLMASPEGPTTSATILETFPVTGTATQPAITPETPSSTDNTAVVAGVAQTRATEDEPTGPAEGPPGILRNAPRRRPAPCPEDEAITEEESLPDDTPDPVPGPRCAPRRDGPPPTNGSKWVYMTGSRGASASSRIGTSVSWTMPER